MKPPHLFLLFLLPVTLALHAADPTATQYTATQCLGSYMPYPTDVQSVAVPDSLEAIALSHIGRHGARFLASEKPLKLLREALDEAESAATISPLGRELKRLCATVTNATAGRWGALDSVGIAEQTLLATRMARTFPALMENGRIEAMSSYSPRCIMSMYAFAHQLSRMNNKVEIYTSSGRQNSALLRPFDADADYREYISEGTWQEPLAQLTAQLVEPSALLRALGKNFPGADNAERMRSLAMAEYEVVRALPAMGLPNVMSHYFTAAEMNALWAVDNLNRYLRYSASTLTTTTAEMAAPLLVNMLSTLDAAAAGDAGCRVALRFGHAETMMPLLALMHLPGCYYMTNLWDTVALHWRDFYVVPMASNLRLVLLKHKKSGALYLRVDLNETPIPLIPGRSAVYTPWVAAREYLNRCLPLLYQN